MSEPSQQKVSSGGGSGLPPLQAQAGVERPYYSPSLLKGSLFHIIASTTLATAMDQDRKNMVKLSESMSKDKPTFPQQQQPLSFPPREVTMLTN